MLQDCSFEIAARGHARLAGVQSEISQGTTISVAFLAGDTIAGLVEAAAYVRRLGFTPKPHISARCLSSEKELVDLLTGLRDEAGVDRAFVVGGDPPKPAGPYRDALGVIETGLLGEFGIKRVGIAGYPDGHPTIANDLLWDAMLRKITVLANRGHELELVTQFGFDATPILGWLDQVRRHGVKAEVRVGLPGPASVGSLLHFATRCGVTVTTAAAAKYGMSLTAPFSSVAPDRLLRDLAAGLGAGAQGRVGVHFHPFGGLDKAVKWMRERMEG